MSQEQIDKIGGIGKVTRASDAVQAVNEDFMEKGSADADSFARLMAEKNHQAHEIAQHDEKNVLRPGPVESVEEGQRRTVHHKDDLPGLIAQSDTAVEKIEAIKQRLSVGDIELSRPVRTGMNRSLVHMDEALKIALSKVGVDYTPSNTNTQGLLGPVQKFVGLLNNGQSQLEALSTQLTNLHGTSAEISPANMLALQLKMGLITQQVEFFASLLNKSLESTKTIMNVQV